MELKKGSVIGGILLISGSCIGAGMLALPVITGVGGFIPSAILFFFSWLFMTITALLLLEANLTLGYQLSLISIAKKTLGPVGKLLCWILFVFLFYSLGIAYIAASGDIVKGIASDFLSIQIPTWVGSVVFTLFFGIVIYLGTRPVDYLNRILMVGLLIAYLLLVILGTRYVRPALLAHSNWKLSFISLPVLVISFGFHNMIPSLAEYLHGDIGRLKKTVIFGSLIPLAIYLIWEAVLLGIIPVEGRGGLADALDKGSAATTALRMVVGKAWVCTVADAFALFAIITSFLAQSLSLVDFLSDGLKIPKKHLGRVFLIALTLVPPFVFAFLYPGIFIQALNMAGGFSAVLLFGVMPALMVWILRYRQRIPHPVIVPWGRFLLVLVLIAAFAIFFLELAKVLGFYPSSM